MVHVRFVRLVNSVLRTCEPKNCREILKVFRVSLTKNEIDIVMAYQENRIRDENRPRIFVLNYLYIVE